MTTETLEQEDTSTGTGDKPRELFHYVRKDQIAQSAVEGAHVVALCGETFPVTKVPKKGAAVCPDCKRIYETMRK